MFTAMKANSRKTIEILVKLKLPTFTNYNDDSHESTKLVLTDKRFMPESTSI